MKGTDNELRDALQDLLLHAKWVVSANVLNLSGRLYDLKASLKRYDEVLVRHRIRAGLADAEKGNTLTAAEVREHFVNRAHARKKS